MQPSDYRIVVDPTYGYRRLEPVPGSEDISRFYQSQYYHLLQQGGRASDLRRIMAGGDPARRETEWLRASLYSDIAAAIRELAPGNRVFDVGCGPGKFIAYLLDQDFEASGIEPSPDAAAVARSRSLQVRNCSLEDFLSDGAAEDHRRVDAVTLLHVLEHVVNPAEVMESLKALLSPGGVVCVMVPNDFSEIQLAAQSRLGKEPWWFAIPDHINYFDFQSLVTFLQRVGYETVHLAGDFPMEFFLLMGDDYTNNPDLGNACHQKRVDFELAIPGDLRRRMYQHLAAAGIGRDCLAICRCSGNRDERSNQ